MWLLIRNRIRIVWNNARRPFVQPPQLLYRVYHNRITRIRYTMSEPHTIYNCEMCMFLTRNKKDYTRHLKSRKHLENHPPGTDATEATPPPPKTQHCAKCNKEFKSRTSVYTHIKKCNAATDATPDPASLTPEQIQYILMENKILKELLKNVIQGHHPAAAAASPPNHSV